MPNSSRIRRARYGGVCCWSRRACAVLEDLSVSGSPATWAGQAIAGYHKYRANLIVAEANHGGDMVITTLGTQDATVATKKVWASQGKYARAEPISALYEKGLVHHVGMFAELEDQLCNWAPAEGLPSPNELDALVWALTELMLGYQLPQGLSLLPALEGMQKASLAAQGATPSRRGPPGERLPRAWPGSASRPRFGGRVFRDEYDEDL